MDTVELFSIKNLEHLTGIKAHTLRIWEKRYGILKPQRTDSNIRYYSNDDLRLLLNINLLNKNGYKISDIAQMSSSDIRTNLSGMKVVKGNMEGLEENLLLSVMEINEQKFNALFVSLIINMGFEKAFVNIIFPFFERIGLLWQTGAINPAQEHYFSNLVRQKLIAAIDGLEFIHEPSQKTVLLFLPEHELHEISLLFYSYAFKARRYKTIYLGQSVPLEGIDKVISTCGPDMIVTGMTNSINPVDCLTMAKKLVTLLPGKNIYITGPVPDVIKDSLPENCYTGHQLRNLLTL